MGYCITLNHGNITIKADKKPFALEAVRALAQQTTAIHKRFDWVDTDDFFLAKTLEGALKAWRYEARVDKTTGDINGVEFLGEKLGDDDTLWKALAPFIENESYLEYSGEDGAMWRWSFINGQFREQSPNWSNA